MSEKNSLYITLQYIRTVDGEHEYVRAPRLLHQAHCVLTNTIALGSVCYK